MMMVSVLSTIPDRAGDIIQTVVDRGLMQIPCMNGNKNGSGKLTYARHKPG